MLDKTNCVDNPGSVKSLADDIAAKKLSPVDLVKRYIDRIGDVQPICEPWREVDTAGALAIAKKREAEAAAGQLRGPLHGVPFGVKDVIDVAGLPTRANCKALQDSSPATADAEIVLALRTAGAIPLGKVHTTEFAFFHPSPAANPYNREHTPGGSSSGSGAAVASGTVPITLGTQTMASVNRPAAYCGISAFKPSSRILSTHGICVLAPSYDTIGFYGWRVEDAITAFETIAPMHIQRRGPAPTPNNAHLIRIDDPLISDMDPDMAAAFEASVDKLGQTGHKIETRAAPFSFERLGVLHWRTMHYEIARINHFRLDYGDGLSERFTAAIHEGLAVSETDYLNDRAEMDMLRLQFFEAMAGADGFIWPAAPAAAPRGLASTGEPKYIAPWTALNNPIATIPVGLDSHGMPLGVVLCGWPGEDLSLCGLSRTVAGAIEMPH